MKETIDALEALQARIAQALSVLDIESLKIKQRDLEQQMQAPDFWDDHKQAQRVSKQAAHIAETVTAWQQLADDTASLLELAQEDQSAKDVNLRTEIDEQVAVLEKKYTELELALYMREKYDDRGAVISIHAGAGGDDAQDWAEMLSRMYTRWAEQHDVSYEILDITRGNAAGVKSVTLLLDGTYTYGQLKGEHGVHRLVRLSPFDADHGRHTSFAFVEVLPDLDDVADVNLDMQDVRIDTFTSSGKGGQSVNTTYSAVRVVHEPTGIAVSCQNERSQLHNKETALKILTAKLQKLANDQRVEHVKDLKGEHKEMAWGNQIRSYVLHPYKQVKDLRTNFEHTNPDAVLDGELDEFIDAYLRFKAQEDRN